MPSTPQEVQEEILSTVRKSQETVIEAIKSWVETDPVHHPQAAVGERTARRQTAQAGGSRGQRVRLRREAAGQPAEVRRGHGEGHGTAVRRQGQGRQVRHRLGTREVPVRGSAGSPELPRTIVCENQEAAVKDAWQAQREALGAFIRTQRRMANLSLRQLAELTHLSNPYLSQIERGLHQPSVRVLKQISDALNLSAETLMAQAGLIDGVAADADGGADRAAGRSGGPADRGRHPGRRAAQRGAEGGPHRRLPQHARLAPPRANSPALQPARRRRAPRRPGCAREPPPGSGSAGSRGRCR